MSWLQDLHYALRALARRPMYAVVTIAVLAIAIGANTTVFSVLNGLFLRPLPYPDGERLVVVYDSYTKVSNLANAGTAIPDYLERREQAKSLESLAIFTGAARTLGGEGEPVRLLTTRASASLFTVLGAAPQVGRVFTDEEATAGNDNRVVVLSDRLWRTRFGASDRIVGRDIRLDDDSFRVIGVMPPAFGYPTRNVDAWTPFAFTTQQMADTARGNQFSTSIGRLRPGATVEELNAELAAIVDRNFAAGRIPRDFVEVGGFTGRATPLRAQSVGNLEPMVLLLQAGVLAVLLIACANVANLQLARVAARRRELAVRAALGAQSVRLVRLVLIESLVLSLLGALGGLLLAVGGLQLVRSLGLDLTSQGFEFRLDTAVLAFTLGAAVIAALVAALPPVIVLVRDDLMRIVREGRQGGGGRAAHTLRSTLVVVQIAVGVALLASASLLAKGFYRLQSEGPGFDSGGVWTSALGLPRGRYPTPESWAQFDARVLEVLRTLPGVSAAGFTSVLPFTGNNNQGDYAIDGYTPPTGAPAPHAQQRSISDGYLQALGMPVVEGRTFAPSEPERVAIIDTNVARKYWPAGQAIGQRLRMATEAADVWYTVVGVVPPVKQTDHIEDASAETIYFHYTQRPVQGGRLVLRTTLPVEQLTGPAKAAIAAIDPNLALADTQVYDRLVQRALGPERAPMVLTLVFAAVAFTLAVIGVYAVLTWAAAQRFAEIGVRLALGAQTRDIVRMVVAQGGRLILIGSVLGLVGAVAVGRVLASQMRTVSAFDPAVLASAVLVLAAAALIASWLPARRAGNTSPTVALRAE